MNKFKVFLFLVLLFFILTASLPLLFLISLYCLFFCKEDKVIFNEAKKELAKFKKHCEEDESFKAKINEMSASDKFDVYNCYMAAVDNKTSFDENKAIKFIKKKWPLPYAMWKPKEESMYNEIRAKAWFLWALEDLGIEFPEIEDIEFVYNTDYLPIDIEKFKNIFNQ